ncbi:CRM-domain containing factor CFM3, chloroplastic/mitochondrial [Senna tora]|uniref:CRM-domain containing factor CFM3, chloroplastic/mitochondrial n=1 Tax=Senna tora TaxID=362788 RepID=A0A834SN88_9FABA|nr:CRM-domain containing factor CFM3, chloroplastic/mitochondrial [Senna tora]
MALPPFPLNSPSSCVSSTFSSSSSLHFLPFQPQFHSFSGSQTLKFRLSCSNHTVQVDTEQPRRVKVTPEGPTKKKKKNSPRPSFFEEIRDKWSLKLSSQREKFPWEEEPEPQGIGGEEGRDQKSSVAFSSEPNGDVRASVSLQFRSRVSPWQQAVKPKVYSKPGTAENDGKPLKYNVNKSVDDRGNGKIGRELYDIDEIPVRVKKTREPIRLMDGKRVYSNIRTSTEQSRGAGNLGSQEMNVVEGREGDRKGRSNTELAERMLPEHELRRLRNMALRMVERFDVGVAGITQELVDSIHEKWRVDEVVKLKFEGPLAANMRRTHEILETKTGGLVVWRSGGSVVLYRQSSYKLPCVQTYIKLNHANVNSVHHTADIGTHAQEPVRTTDPAVRDSTKYLKNLSEEEYMELSDLNHLLDELGPRFKDWSGREPVPVDADLLPAVVPGYKTPFRLLPHGVRPGLKDKEMTNFRRLARTAPPHFVLGRNRQLQGLANAMVKLWEKSAIAKIAIKRGVVNTRNERMAEELKKLTGGTLLSRNKDYIVFYRGNDFLPPFVTEVLTERQKLAMLQQDDEEQARQIASSMTKANGKASQVPLVAGTLAETRAATTHWGHQPSSQEVEKMRRDLTLNRFTSIIRNLEKKLALAKAKVKKAEKNLAKVQNDLEPADLPNDLETLTNEERFSFRKIGLSMKPYLLLGRRDVYSGTIENMHLHWKYRELVKIIVNGKNSAQVKHIAISLEAESGGVLVSVDKTTKGYVIIVYRGKNYLSPRALRPKNLLSRRQALARSIELQRREDDMANGKKMDFDETLYSRLGGPNYSDDDLEENEGSESETYFDKYDSGSEDEKIELAGD